MLIQDSFNMALHVLSTWPFPARSWTEGVFPKIFAPKQFGETKYSKTWKKKFFIFIDYLSIYWFHRYNFLKSKFFDLFLIERAMF